MLRLPTSDGKFAGLSASPTAGVEHRGLFNRIALAAAHVVADPRADVDPWMTAAIDWDATIQYRRHLWSLGLGVAEAMDTSQRGMGLGWKDALQLISLSLDAARDLPGAIIFSGAGTDHLAPGPAVTIDDVIKAYEEQISAIERLDGRIILMASRALAAAARSPDDYARVYGRISSRFASRLSFTGSATCSIRRSRDIGGTPTPQRRRMSAWQSWRITPIGSTE